MNLKQLQKLGNNSFGFQTENFIQNIYIPELRGKEFAPSSGANYEGIILDEPEIPEKCSQREARVKQAIDILEKYSWLHIRGDNGSGKTLLALTIAKSLTSKRFWFPFDRDPNKNPHRLFRYIFSEYIKCDIPNMNIESFFEEVFSNFPLKNSPIFILDDLPNLSDEPNLSQLLSIMSKVGSKYRIKIISTGYQALPEKLISSSEEYGIKVIDNPPFSNEEIEELLRFNNAPEKLDHRFCTLAQSVTQGHPVLIRALIHFLKNINWKYDLEIFTKIINKDFSKETLKNKLSLFSEIESEDIKELIYRLDLLLTDFSEEEIALVGNVEPKIKHPNEKIFDVSDIWIRRIGNKYSLSPLLKSTGKKNLPTETIKSVCLKLAEHLIQNPLNQNTALTVMLYFIDAEEYNEAAKILLLALKEHIKADCTEEDWPILICWTDKTLPKEISLQLRIIIRISQIRIFENKASVLVFLLSDLANLFKESDKMELPTLLHAITILSTASSSDSTNLFFHLVQQSVEYNFLVDTDKEQFAEMFIKSIWAFGSGIDNISKLVLLLEAIGQFPKAYKDLVLNYSNASEIVEYIFRKIHLSESEKPEKHRNYSELQQNLKIIEKKAHELSLETFWGCAIKMRLTILGENLDKLEEAIKVGLEALSIASDNEYIQYILNASVARAYYLSEDYKNSDQHYTSAHIDVQISRNTFFINEKIMSRFFHCAAVSYFDKKKAVYLSKESIDIAIKNEEKLDPIFIICALGEHTIHTWNYFGLKDAFFIFEDALKRLLPMKFEKASEQMIQFFVLGRYLSILSQFGSLDVFRERNKVDFDSPKPTPGMFFTSPKKTVNDKNVLRMDLLFRPFLWAIALDIDESAMDWGTKIEEEYKKNPELIKFIYPYKLYFFAFLIAKDDLKGAIDFDYLFFEDTRISSAQNSFQSNLSEIVQLYFVFYYILPIILKIGYLKIKGILKSSEVSELLSTMRKKLEVEYSSNKFVMNVLTLLENSTNKGQIEDTCTDFDKIQLELLRIIAFLIQVIVNHDSLENSLILHKRIIDSIVPLYALDLKAFLYRTMILPFFQEYWDKKFRENRFRFVSPDIIQDELKKAFDSPPEHAVGNILKVIARGLNIRLG